MCTHVLQLYRQIQGSGDVSQNAYDLDLDEDDVQQARPRRRCPRCHFRCRLHFLRAVPAGLDLGDAQPGGSGALPLCRHAHDPAMLPVLPCK